MNSFFFDRHHWSGYEENGGRQIEVHRPVLQTHCGDVAGEILCFSTRQSESLTYTVLSQINAHPEINAIRNKRPPKTVIFQRGEYTKPMAFNGWFFKGGSTQNRWALMGDFSKGGVHKIDGFSWVIFQRGKYKTDGFWNVFLLFQKLSPLGVYFGKYGDYRVDF